MTEVSLLGASDTTEQLAACPLKTFDGDDIVFNPWTGGSLGLATVIAEGEKNPIEAARRIHKLNQNSPILIICPEPRKQDYQKELLFAPNVGMDTKIIPNHNIEVIRDTVIRHVNTGIKKQNYQAQMSNAHETLASANSYQIQSPLVMRNLLGQLPIGVMTISINHQLLNLNPAAQKMLGLDSDEVCGRSIYKWLPDKACSSISFLMAEALSTGNIAHNILEYRLQNNTVYYKMTASRADPASSKRGALMLLEDVTQKIEDDRAMDEYQHLLTRANHDLEQRVNERTLELEQAKEKLKQRNRQLLRSNEDLEKFSFIAAHDLSEPLRKISVFADLLDTRSREILDNKARNYLGSMQRSSVQLRELIESLLAYSRINSTGLGTEEVNLNKALKQAENDLQVAIRENNATILAEVLPTIEANHLQINQVLQNLISNSLRYRHPDITPEISIRSEADVSGQHCIIIYQDNGRGFDSKYKEQIFKPFERLDNGKIPKGSGIGLAICYQVCARHGGSITADSQADQGAVFRITLPYRQTDNSGQDELN